MKTDMTWLVGLKVAEVGKKDYTWFFTFDDHSTICTESPWRLITEEGIRVTSEDHGQKFGLPAPVDAADLSRRILGDSKINRTDVRDKTSDLVLNFSNHAVLEFLNLSSGFEAWRSVHGTQQVFCIGGGGLTEFKNEGRANQAFQAIGDPGSPQPER
jgi:hypothetical protein